MPPSDAPRQRFILIQYCDGRNDTHACMQVHTSRSSNEVVCHTFVGSTSARVFEITLLFPPRAPCPSPPQLRTPPSFASMVVTVSKSAHALSSNNSPRSSAHSLSWRRCLALSRGDGVRGVQKRYFPLGGGGARYHAWP